MKICILMPLDEEGLIKLDERSFSLVPDDHEFGVRDGAMHWQDGPFEIAYKEEE